MIGKLMDKSKKEPFAAMGIGPLVQNIRKLNSKLIVPVTPRQLLIDTYPVPILRAMAKLSPVPVQAPESFSFMANRNHSTRGVWTVFTGKSNSSMTGVIKSWNNQTELSDCWRGEPCDQIRGSEGAFFPPPFTPEREISIFSPELNVSLVGTFSHAYTENSLLKYRFKLFDKQFDNQEKTCYCTKAAEEEQSCPLDGLIDLNTCTRGLPFIMSKPHYYNSHKSLPEFFIGLSPNKSQHESFLDIDPFLGVATRATVRMQLNVDLNPIKKVP